MQRWRHIYCPVTCITQLLQGPKSGFVLERVVNRSCCRGMYARAHSIPSMYTDRVHATSTELCELSLDLGHTHKVAALESRSSQSVLLKTIPLCVIVQEP